MSEYKLNNVEETLFVPMRGRVFASKKFKNILYDQKALEISKKLPQKYMNTSKESEYTLLASATRSMNIDLKIRAFLEKNPRGTIINLGAGLETTFYRNNNNNATWYELDLYEVTQLRKEIFGENEHDKLLTCSMFDYDWIEKVKENSHEPFLIIASGVFYYFKMTEVLDLLNNLHQLGSSVEVVFDCVSKTGIKFTKKYMKDLGKEDTIMYFYVDNPDDLINNIRNAKLIESMDYYSNIKSKKGMKLITKISMKISDMFHMVKLIHIKIE